MRRTFAAASRAFVLVVCAICALCAWCVLGVTRAYAATPAVVVSLGDSYASGEGTEPFYGQGSANKYDDDDYLAHRSELAWPGKLQLRGQQLSAGKGSTWYFSAASQAFIKHVTTTPQTISWKSSSTRSGSKDLPVQTSVFSTQGIKGSVDYVTLTIGGNDLDFRGILTTAATQDIPFISNGSLESKMNKVLSTMNSTVLPELSSTYKTVLDAAGNKATLIVVGYPHLFYKNVSNIFFNSSKAKLINDAIDQFNDGMANVVKDMGTSRVVFVNPTSEFEGHEAYAPDSYINSLIFGSEAEDLDQTMSFPDASSYSVHPNANGQAAYARVVQATIDKLEQQNPSSVAATGVTLNRAALTLTTKGETAQLAATVAPSNASNKSVTWSSSNSSVATVSSNGLVTAVSNGSTTISAKTVDGGFMASCTVTVNIPQDDPQPQSALLYRTHVQTYGWQGWKGEGEVSGTSGESKRLEGIQVKLQNAPYAGGVTYRTHVQSYGWMDWAADGAMSGTSGESKRLEAIQMELTGTMAQHYDIYYRVHAQTYGWMGWAKNGECAGTATYGKRLEAIQIVLVPQGDAAPSTTYNGIVQQTASAYETRQVRYRTHVQTYGWQDWKYDGVTSGTSGESKRLEAIQITLPDTLLQGNISYRTHVQSYGWMGWVSNGSTSGTSGESKRLEAIEIKLSGDVSEHYDVWYRVHAQTYGWLGWVCNGASAGTSGLGKRLEAIEITLLPKGSTAPGSTRNPFVSAESDEEGASVVVENETIKEVPVVEVGGPVVVTQESEEPDIVVVEE